MKERPLSPSIQTSGTGNNIPSPPSTTANQQSKDQSTIRNQNPGIGNMGNVTMQGTSFPTSGQARPINAQMNYNQQMANQQGMPR